MKSTDIRTLRQIARQAQDIVSQAPGIAVLRDDWFPDDVQQRIQIDPDRANVAGITNADVADASTAAMSGSMVGVFKEGDKNIPIVARLRMEERAQLADIKNLYVYSSQTNNRVPLLSVATVGNSLETGRIVRREHFRTISILCYPGTRSSCLGSTQSDSSKIARVPEKSSPRLSAADRGRKSKTDRRIQQPQNRSVDFFDRHLPGAYSFSSITR